MIEDNSVRTHRAAPRLVKTPQLSGHAVRDDDVDYVIEVDGDPRIQRWLFGQVQTEAQARARHGRWMQGWEMTGIGFWVFTDGSGATVGHGGIFQSPRELGEIEVGYAVKPAYWGRGFATEITRVSLAVGFNIGLRRIIGIAQASNLASRRVLEKCGMLFELETPSPDGINGVRYAITAPQ